MAKTAFSLAISVGEPVLQSEETLRAADLVELKTVERFTSDIAACAAVTLQFRLSLLDFLTTELGTFN